MVAPDPLTPANCDLRDFPRMMVDISRLRQSDFDAITDDAAWRAGFNLWFSAWHSVPAGSLTDDDAALAKAAGLGRDLRTWRKVKQDALRGFVACSDGRLYHRAVCEFALEAWIEKLIQKISSGAGNAKRWGGEFDPTPIEAEIDNAVSLLTAINPDSKVIPKARRRHSRPNPTGKHNSSHRDNNGVPVGSQEKGKGKQEEKEEGSQSQNQSENAAGDLSLLPLGGDEAPAPGGARGPYAFAGSIIRLNDIDLRRWRKTYHSIADLDAELVSLDAWFQGAGADKAKNWFHVAQSALNKRHQAILREERSAEASSGPPMC